MCRNLAKRLRHLIPQVMKFQNTPLHETDYSTCVGGGFFHLFPHVFASLTHGKGTVQEMLIPRSEQQGYQGPTSSSEVLWPFSFQIQTGSSMQREALVFMSFSVQLMSLLLAMEDNMDISAILPTHIFTSP